MESKPNNNFDIFQLVFNFEEMLISGEEFYLDENAFLQILEYYAEEQEYQNALKAANIAIDRFKYSVDFYIKKVECLFYLKRWKEAEKALDETLSIAPYDFDTKLLGARIKISLKKYKAAQTILEEIKNGADNQELGRIFFLEGLIFEAKEEYDQMFDSIKFALLCDPTNENALRKIWVCTEMEGRFDESIVLHNSIIDEDPYSYLAWYNLGQAYACNGDYDKALVAYEYSYLIEPTFELGYQDRADLLFELQRYQEALFCYSEWYEITGPDSEILCQIGHCNLRLGDYDKAKHIFKKAQRLDPYNDEIYFLLGRCYYKKEDYSNAINAFYKAIRIESLREEYYSSLASAYVKIKEFTKAHYYFQKAEEIGPDQSYIWKKHALFLFKIGEYNTALDVIDEGIENAMDSELLYCKAGFLVQMDKNIEAMDILEEALVENFDGNRTFYEVVDGLELDPNIVSLLRFFTPQNS